MKLPWVKWFLDDWLSDDAVTACSPATRGIWMDWLCAMTRRQTGSLTGTGDMLARLGRCSDSDVTSALAELQTNNAADVSRHGDVITVVCRRLKREENARKANAEAQRRHRIRGGIKPPSYDGKAPDTRDQNSEIRVLPPVVSPSSDISPAYSHSPRARANGEIDSYPLEVCAGVVNWYPKHRRGQPRKAAIAVQGALSRIAVDDAHPGHSDPLAWLQAQTRAFADSHAGKSGRFTPMAHGWFDGAGYDAPPESWQAQAEPDDRDKPNVDSAAALRRFEERHAPR